jgi:hypothetical protein
VNSFARLLSLLLAGVLLSFSPEAGAPPVHPAPAAPVGRPTEQRPGPTQSSTDRPSTSTDGQGSNFSRLGIKAGPAEPATPSARPTGDSAESRVSGTDIERSTNRPVDAGEEWGQESGLIVDLALKAGYSLELGTRLAVDPEFVRLFKESFAGDTDANKRPSEQAFRTLVESKFSDTLRTQEASELELLEKAAADAGALHDDLSSRLSSATKHRKIRIREEYHRFLVWATDDVADDEAIRRFTQVRHAGLFDGVLPRSALHVMLLSKAPDPDTAAAFGRVKAQLDSPHDYLAGKSRGSSGDTAAALAALEQLIKTGVPDTLTEQMLSSLTPLAGHLLLVIGHMPEGADYVEYDTGPERLKIPVSRLESLRTKTGINVLPAACKSADAASMGFSKNFNSVEILDALLSALKREAKWSTPNWTTAAWLEAILPAGQTFVMDATTEPMTKVDALDEAGEIKGTIYLPNPGSDGRYGYVPHGARTDTTFGTLVKSGIIRPASLDMNTRLFSIHAMRQAVQCEGRRSDRALSAIIAGAAVISLSTFALALQAAAIPGTHRAALGLPVCRRFLCNLVVMALVQLPLAALLALSARQGHPTLVLPGVALLLGAGLIVSGATGLARRGFAIAWGLTVILCAVIFCIPQLSSC